MSKIPLTQIIKELVKSEYDLVYENYLMTLDIYDVLEVIIGDEFLLANDYSKLYMKDKVILILNELLYK